LDDVGILVVRRQLTGHKSSVIHRKYTHLSLVPLRAAMARLRSSAVLIADDTDPYPSSKDLMRSRGEAENAERG